MSKFIFQISKFNASKGQLRLKERYNSARDCVTALATLHIGANSFLSGMHYAYQDSEGDVKFSFNKSTDASKIKVDVNANFKPEQLESLMTQITELGTSLTKPPINEDGVSELRGLQLHVVFNSEDISYYQEADEKHGDKLVYKIQSHQIKSVRIVTASDEGYIQAPGARKVNVDMAMNALYDVTVKEEEFVKPTTVAETKTALLDFSKAKSRGASRKEKKLAAVQTEVAASVMSTSNTSIILVDDEDEDDKPE